MARHTALQPLWSFVSGTRPYYTPPRADAVTGARGAAVQRWAAGPDGRPRPSWTMGRPQADDA